MFTNKKQCYSLSLLICYLTFISHDLISHLLKVVNVFIVNTVPVIIEKYKYPDQLFIHIDPLNNYLNRVNKEGEKDIKAIHIWITYMERK